MLMTSEDLIQQRDLYRDMPGINFGHLCTGFMPAFRDEMTGETHLCANPDGSFAVIHVIDSLPPEWIDEWDGLGRPVSLIDTVTAGFMRGESFYTLNQLKDRAFDA